METEAVNTIIESIKVAAPLCAVLMSFLIWREQKRNQIEQAIVNAENQKEIANLNAKNNLELKKREFELKFFEEIIRQRLSDYGGARETVAKIISSYPITTLNELGAIIDALNTSVHQTISLSNDVGLVWRHTIERIMIIYDNAKKSDKSDDFVVEHHKEISYQLIHLLLKINHGFLSVNDLEEMKKDAQIRLVHAAKNLTKL